MANINIYVYADWQGMQQPILVGLLCAHQAKSKKAFSFTYDKKWLASENKFVLDPQLQLYAGAQFAEANENFGVFLDSMPDTWGRTLMVRREIMNAKTENRKPNNLYDINFLLGVFDPCRSGALRFKLAPNQEFLDNNAAYATPPWTSIADLQKGVAALESDKQTKASEKWIKQLIAPGSSLGGARPKANIMDLKGNLWIAKFPSKTDVINKALWEFLLSKLAYKASIPMAECKAEKINGGHHTFFTKRFDRHYTKRTHFASAMTMTGNSEEKLKTQTASYLDIAEAIQYNCADVKSNLQQLWRRMVFNIFISNTDDHLRNHGFLLNNNAWELSPAFDINASNEKEGLALNIDLINNNLDVELAKSVGMYFMLSTKEMNAIIIELSAAIKNWQSAAKKLGIIKTEIDLMESAFSI